MILLFFHGQDAAVLVVRGNVAYVTFSSNAGFATYRDKSAIVEAV